MFMAFGVCRPLFQLRKLLTQEHKYYKQYFVYSVKHVI
jgi:hypothetical protein